MRMAFGIPKAIRMADSIFHLPLPPHFRSVVTVVEKSKFLSVYQLSVAQVRLLIDLPLMVSLSNHEQQPVALISR